MSNNRLLAFEEGWLTPPWFHLYFRHFILLIFWLMQLKLLISDAVKANIRAGNKHWYHWIWLYQIHQVFYLAPIMVFLIFEVQADIRAYSEKFAITSLLLLYFCLLFKPHILYGIRGVPSSHRIFGNKPVITNGSMNPGLSQEQVEQLLNRIDQLMRSKRPYLIPGYSLSDLAADTGTSYRTVSSVLNKNIGANFNEFINKHRIEFFLGRVKQGDHQNKTIEGLAMECGFNNRNSFTKAFKALKRTTPSNYIKYYRSPKSANIST
jgi:AraC-like DNA-binding protein